MELSSMCIVQTLVYHFKNPLKLKSNVINHMSPQARIVGPEETMNKIYLCIFCINVNALLLHCIYVQKGTTLREMVASRPQISF